jgi:hypothetical protein
MVLFGKARRCFHKDQKLTRKGCIHQFQLKQLPSRNSDREKASTIIPECTVDVIIPFLTKACMSCMYWTWSADTPLIYSTPAPSPIPFYLAYDREEKLWYIHIYSLGRIHRRKVRDLWSGISSKTTFSSWFVSCLDQIIPLNKSELSLVQSLLIQPIRWSRYI